MEKGRSNAPPTLDDDSSHSDTLIPNKLFTSITQQHKDTKNAHECAEAIVGDTHLEKIKTKLYPLESKGKRVKFDDEEEEFDTE